MTKLQLMKRRFPKAARRRRILSKWRHKYGVTYTDLLEEYLPMRILKSMHPIKTSLKTMYGIDIKSYTSWTGTSYEIS